MYANGSQISLWCRRWSDETSQQGKSQQCSKRKRDSSDNAATSSTKQKEKLVD